MREITYRDCGVCGALPLALYAYGTTLIFDETDGRASKARAKAKAPNKREHGATAA